MAATIATARGEDRTRTKETHRLGSVCSRVEAATWNTFARAAVWADGSGYVEVQDVRGNTIHRFDFGPESERS